MSDAALGLTPKIVRRLEGESKQSFVLVILSLPTTPGTKHLFVMFDGKNSITGAKRVECATHNTAWLLPLSCSAGRPDLTNGTGNKRCLLLVRSTHTLTLPCATHRHVHNLSPCRRKAAAERGSEWCAVAVSVRIAR